MNKEFKKQTIYPEHIKHSIYDSSDIIRKHTGNFFSKDAMRFFNSRVLSEVFVSPKSAYFVTSEKFDSKSERLYSVRKLNLNNFHIETMGPFQRYSSRTKALSEALNLAYEETNPIKRI